MNQFVWCNKFITETLGNKKNVLFLRNWIRSGIRKVNDLRFIDGILDMNYVYGKVLEKKNIYCEILLVREALYPFRDAIKNNNINSTYLEKTYKPKDMYNIFISKKYSEDLTFCSAYLSQYATLMDEEHAFRSKVFLEREIKLKEFNFKILHGILSCNNNLMRWKIKTSGKCDVCNEIQTIKHLLFDCTYVKPVWNIVNNQLALDISYQQILGLDKSFDHNAIVTIICFIIYKEWLVLSFQNKARSHATSMTYFKNELQVRANIYTLCKSIADTHINDIIHIASSM